MARRAIKSLQKRKKVKKFFARSLNTTLDKAPTNDFFSFKDFVRTEVDKKNIGRYIRKYMKENFSKSDQKIMKFAEDWRFTTCDYIGASLYWASLNKKFPSTWNHKRVVKVFFDNIYEKGQQNLKKVKIVDEFPKKSIQDIIKIKTSKFIGEIESRIDEYDPYKHDECMEYSIYADLMIHDAPYNMAKAIYDYYIPQMNELNELTTSKSEDLVEAYSYLKPLHRKKLLAFIKKLCDETERYMISKKSVRKITRKKIVPVTKQISKIKYLKSSDEYKLQSLNPEKIIGVRRLYTFNVKYKKLTEYVSDQANGFSIKGTTIQGIDENLSREVKLRKPEDILNTILKKSPIQINKEWKKLTTKSKNGPNGRINNNTILMRVLNK